MKTFVPFPTSKTFMLEPGQAPAVSIRKSGLWKARFFLKGKVKNVELRDQTFIPPFSVIAVPQPLKSFNLSERGYKNLCEESLRGVEASLIATMKKGIADVDFRVFAASKWTLVGPFYILSVAMVATEPGVLKLS